MPEINRDALVDNTDIADDDVASLEDPKIQQVIYRVTEKLKAILQNQQAEIVRLYALVTAMQEEIDSLP